MWPKSQLPDPSPDSSKGQQPLQPNVWEPPQEDNIDLFDCREDAPLLIERVAPEPSIGSRFDPYESLLFQSLLPAFDDAAIRRVRLLCLYLIDPSDDQWWTSQALNTADFTTVHAYDFLKGSSLSRHVVQNNKRETFRQSEAMQIEFAKVLGQNLASSGANITININLGSHPLQPREEAKDWPEKFKDFTEGIKNTILIGAGGALLFGSTLVTSEKAPEMSDLHRVTIMHLDRKAQLEVLPKILDAEKPEDFKEIIEFVQTPSSVTSPKPGRKFR
jgi:hypothetical protein